MKKLKFSSRISLTYMILFTCLMLCGAVFVVTFLKIQDTKNIREAYQAKIVEIETFLDKIDSFSKKYESISLEFKPKFENNSIVYSKPFEPGLNEFLYVVRIRNSNKYDEIALNTFNEEENNNFIKDFNNITQDNINTNKTTSYNYNNKAYTLIRINRTISGNVFDIYILKDISSNIQIYKVILLIMIVYTFLSMIFIIVISTSLTNKMLSPINHIVETANNISESNNLTIRIKETGTGDELDTLIKIINNMLERLNIAFDNQSKFISDVSHELRTPLSIITGYAELIKRRVELNNPLVNESLNLVINESVNMKNLINKLLFLAKGDINSVKLNIETFDSVDFIEQLKNDAVFYASEHNIVIEKNVKYTLYADKSLLLQALRAIIENSVKYSAKNTSIYINSYYDIINKEAVISIRDEGIGIDKQYFDKIFERFYRVDESRTKSTGGTGLGLSIVKKILNIHNARIELKSEINVGSEFIFYIPSKITKS